MGAAAASRSYELETSLVERHVKLNVPAGYCEADAHAAAPIMQTLRAFLAELADAHGHGRALRVALVLDVSDLPLLVDPASLHELIAMVVAHRSSFDAFTSIKLLVRPGMQAVLTRLAVAAVAASMPVDIEEMASDASGADVA